MWELCCFLSKPCAALLLTLNLYLQSSALPRHELQNSDPVSRGSGSISVMECLPTMHKVLGKSQQLQNKVGVEVMVWCLCFTF
jgi:hypothetical protein